jgi:hypothetical protein
MGVCSRPSSCADFANSAFIAGGIAACGAVTATHPFETVKIRYVLGLSRDLVPTVC